ncbi:MAG: Uma2 family endonuclease [Deltaproteobacteria bacterium]|nr:Uma2 family endonuclease [Deltaproteobacteria bacterium]
MSSPVERRAVYDDLYGVPENMIGEIINGELIATPRPRRKHLRTSTILGAKVVGPFDLGEGGGPGGWWFLVEPELHFGDHVLVPDLAGWRRERMPGPIEDYWFEVPPDWVCEILSSGTERTDRVRKMPIYAEFGIPHLWLVDPITKTLEVYKLDSGRWVLLETYSQDQIVRGEPFHQVEFNLAHLWIWSPGQMAIHCFFDQTYPWDFDRETLVGP